MFHTELDPENMTRILMEDAIETLVRMTKSGFPLDVYRLITQMCTFLHARVTQVLTEKTFSC